MPHFRADLFVQNYIDSLSRSNMLLHWCYSQRGILGLSPLFGMEPWPHHLLSGLRSFWCFCHNFCPRLFQCLHRYTQRSTHHLQHIITWIWFCYHDTEINYIMINIYQKLNNVQGTCHQIPFGAIFCVLGTFCFICVSHGLHEICSFCPSTPALCNIYSCTLLDIYQK